MARAPAGVPASTRFFSNRITALAFFAVGTGGIVSYLLGARETTDNSGVSNTTLIIVSLVALGISYISARA